MPTHTASRELDALIAERVMGWKWATLPPKEGYTPHRILRYPLNEYAIAGGWVNCGEDVPMAVDALKYVWPYSSSMGAAWKVVEGMRARGFWCIIRVVPSSPHIHVEFTEPSREYRVTTETAPLSICLAALKAIGESK